MHCEASAYGSGFPSTPFGIANSSAVSAGPSRLPSNGGSDGGYGDDGGNGNSGGYGDDGGHGSSGGYGDDGGHGSSGGHHGPHGELSETGAGSGKIVMGATAVGLALGGGALVVLSRRRRRMS